MIFSIRKRLDITRPGAYGGGTLIGPYVELKKLSSEPEIGWEAYIKRNWGPGKFWVFGFCGSRREGFRTVFKGEVGWY